ncbi:cell division protein FtsB [Spongiibacter sp. IMCC21906]|jgi:cell division protein FtsB|uniref:septum formation initiator family protein n=1 Tax=Spongiibacter sp. IMCC21906 TaxID=1620392 RepID=UPI00062DD936|nr:septum formation initiator family protein [Spongiibacter sp. IMCC21906]AKH69569.1 cell division protein FtsB [Spongiibacter sp. IMCC21906]
MTRRRLLVLLLLILIVLQFRLWTGSGSWEQIATLKRDIKAQRVINDDLQQRNQRLYSEVDSLKQNLDSIEERARNDMGLVKKDEDFYLIIENK